MYQKLAAVLHTENKSQSKALVHFFRCALLQAQSSSPLEVRDQRSRSQVKKVLFTQLNNKNMTGTIARITDRGFGFITPAEGEKDVFFHAQSVVDVHFDDLKEGDKVSFDIEEGPKGPSAANVQKAE